MNRLLQLELDRLSGYRYAVLYKDGALVSNTEEMDRRDGREIVVQTPRQFDLQRAGMCHDATVKLAEFCEEAGIRFRCVYLESNLAPDYPTHSFIVVQDETGWHVVDVFSSANCVWKQGFDEYRRAVAERTTAWAGCQNRGSADMLAMDGIMLPPGDMSLPDWVGKLKEKFLPVAMPKYYRVTYGGTGIYEALKGVVPKETWRKLTGMPAFAWLSVPPPPGRRHKTYFTFAGYAMFNKNVLPICEKFLDPLWIKIEMKDDLHDLELYRDDFQVVFSC